MPKYIAPLNQKTGALEKKRETIHTLRRALKVCHVRLNHNEATISAQHHENIRCRAEIVDLRKMLQERPDHRLLELREHLARSLGQMMEAQARAIHAIVGGEKAL